MIPYDRIDQTRCDLIINMHSNTCLHTWYVTESTLYGYKKKQTNIKTNKKHSCWCSIVE